MLEIATCGRDARAPDEPSVVVVEGLDGSDDHPRDDGYDRRHLSAHLALAGLTAELHQLLKCERRGRNLWYGIREAHGEISGYLSDLGRARSSARGPGSDDLARRIRYLLMESSVTSVSAAFPAEAIGEQLRRGRWTAERALVTVARLADPDEQTEILLHIVDQLPDVVVPDVWTLARQLPMGRCRDRLIAKLIPRLPDHLVDGAISAVAETSRWHGMPTAVHQIVERVPESRLNHLWRDLGAMDFDPHGVVRAMVDTRRGVRNSVQSCLNVIVANESNQFLQCQSVAALIPATTGSDLHRVMTVLAGCPARYRSDALIALARHAPANRLGGVLALAGEVDWEITPPESEQQPWVRFAEEIGPRLSGDTDQITAIEVLSRLHLERRAEALEALAPYLGPAAARAGLSRLGSLWSDLIEPDPAIMIPVGALARRLPVPEARSVIGTYVDIDMALRDEPELGVAEMLAPFADYLPTEAVRMVLRTVCRSISLTSTFAIRLRPSLARMVPRLRREHALVAEALAMVTRPSAWRPESRRDVLSVLAPGLDDDLLDEAFDLLLPGPVEVECFTAVAQLGRLVVDERERDGVGHRLLEMAVGTGNYRHRIEALAAAAPVLSPDLAADALEAVAALTRSVTFPSMLRALDALGPQLAPSRLPRALRVLMDVPTINGEDIPHVARLIERLGRDDATGALRRHLHDPDRSAARPKESWLWAIAPYLSPKLAVQALADLPGLPEYTQRISLAALAPRLPAPQRAGVVSHALEILDVAPRDTSIRIAVLARLTEATTTPELTTACRTVLAELNLTDLIDPWHNCWAYYMRLVAHMPTELVQDAFAFTAALHHLDNRCRIIRALAPRLPEPMVRTLTAELLVEKPDGGTDRRERLHALAALAASTSNTGERLRILTLLLDTMAPDRSWYLTGPAYIDVIPLLPPDLRVRAVESAVRTMFSPRMEADVDVDDLLSLLNSDELEVAVESVPDISKELQRAKANLGVLRRAAALAEHPSSSPPIDPTAAWPSAATRADLLTYIAASGWWIRHNGGDRAILSTVDAVFDVCRWWR